MNTRRKKIKAAKKAAKYSSTAAGAASSFLDLVGLFVRIPGLIKWGVVALVGMAAGCFGCCTSEMKEPDAQEQKQEPNDQHLTQLEKEMEEYLAEIKQELKYHHTHPKAAEMKEVKQLLGLGLFSQDPIRQPVTDGPKPQRMDIGVVKLHADLKDPGRGLGLHK